MAKSGIDIRTSPATVGARWAVSDSDERKLQNGMYCRAFIPNVSGTLAVVFADDETNTSVIINVTGGLEYHMQIKKFLSTGTITVTAVTGIG